jgi:hypothetical protein
MNAKQGRILVFAMFLTLISELYPPWIYEYAYVDEFQHKCPAGYSFITRPPAVKTWDEMRSICATSEVPLEKIRTSKDLIRLNWQRLILFSVAAGFFLYFARKNDRLQAILSRTILGIAFALLALYILVSPLLYY